jgi:thioredoxin 1
MALQTHPAQPEPSREEVDALAGPTLLEFGTSWCGHCRAAQPLIAAAFAAHPGVRHLKIEDGSGRRLGRSFGVKLWPTLVFLRDGEEKARTVRPRDVAPIAAGFAEIDDAAAKAAMP